MKYIVVSDIHGSSYYANKLDYIIEKELPDKIILLGDMYYHGPRNPLTKTYNPMEVAEILNKYSDKILCVKGNCDAEVDEMISDFKFEENIELDISNKKFLFTHGHVYNMYNIPKNIDVLIYGHFHKHYIEKVENTICINVGSISLPKDNSKHSYAIINDENIIIKDIEGNLIDAINFK